MEYWVARHPVALVSKSSVVFTSSESILNFFIVEEHMVCVTHELSQLKVYSLQSRELLHRIAISAKRVKVRGHQLFCLSSSEDRIFVYDVVNRNAKALVLRCDGTPTDFVVRVINNTVCVLCVGRDKRIQVIQVPHNSKSDEVKPITCLEGHKDATCCVEVGPNNALYSGACDCNIICWNWDQATNKSNPLVLNGHTDYVLSITFLTQQQQMASCSRDSTVRLWSPQNMCLRMIRMGGGPCLQVQSFGALLTCTLSSSRVAVVPENPNEKRFLCVGHAGKVTRVLRLNATTLITCSSDNSVRTWDLRTGTQLSMLRCHRDCVNAIQIFQDILYSASDDATVKATPLSVVMSSNNTPSRKSLNLFRPKSTNDI